MKTNEEIRGWLVERVAKLAGMEASRIKLDEPLQTYGVSSVKLIEMSGDLEDYLGTTVDPAIFWEFPTIDGMAAHLAKAS